MIDYFDSPPYEFLTNFYPAPVHYDSAIWQSSEHAFQAAKATNDTDRLRIQNARSAGWAKAIGQTIPIRPDWDDVKVGVMRDILRAKFLPGSRLAERLIQTAPHYLEESNTWEDRIWGRVDGVGLNWLGRLLMEVRDDLMGIELMPRERESGHRFQGADECFYCNGTVDVSICPGRYIDRLALASEDDGA